VDQHGSVVGVAISQTKAISEKMNYAVKTSLVLHFLEAAPDVYRRLKEPQIKEVRLEEAAESAKHSAALVLAD
jgi:hypothetical protein